MTTVAVPAVVAADQGRVLSIETGHSIVLRGHNIGRVAVGDAHVAGAVPLDAHEIVINGKAAGETTIFIWDGDVRQTYELTVTEHNLDQIARLLRTALDQPDVHVSTLGDTVIVNGRVSDLAEYDRIDQTIAKFKGVKFGPGPDTTVLNAVSVEKPLGTLQDEIAAIPDAKNLRVDLDTTGNVVVSGRVRDRQQEQAVVDRVNGLAGPYLKTDGKVIDRLAMDAISQVDIKVDVLEVDKTAQSALGFRLQTATQTNIGQGGSTYAINSTPTLVGLENPAKVTQINHPFNVGPFARISLLAPTVDLLLQQGHARLLSSPNLVTLPGKAATFLVGGQIPIPVSNGLGTVSIDYKQFGVQLNVTPTIDADGSVETQVTPEISDLDFADGIQINGFTVPAFKTSRIQTDVITQDGESIVMGGLLRRIEQRTIQKFPVLGDIPILGQLFRSTSYQRTDSDVVFVMTPTIVTKREAVSSIGGRATPLRSAAPPRPVTIPVVTPAPSPVLPTTPSPAPSVQSESPAAAPSRRLR